MENQVDALEPLRRRELDVPVLAAEGDDVVSGERLRERGAELPASAGYEDASRRDRMGDCVLQRWWTRGSSHGTSCSSGSEGSYSSVTW